MRRLIMMTASAAALLWLAAPAHAADRGGHGGGGVSVGHESFGVERGGREGFERGGERVGLPGATARERDYFQDRRREFEFAPRGRLEERERFIEPRFREERRERFTEFRERPEFRFREFRERPEFRFRARPEVLTSFRTFEPQFTTVEPAYVGDDCCCEPQRSAFGFRWGFGW